MTPVLLGALFGLGALLVLAAQPHGRPLPTLKARLESLRPDRRDPDHDDAPPPARVFRMGIFEHGFRPALEASGREVRAITSALGLDLAGTEARLRVTGDPGGLTLFLGQKIAAAVVGFAFLTMASSVWGAGQSPLWLRLAAALFAFFLPDLMLRSRATARREELREGLAHLTDLVALAVSAGLGLDGAIDEALRSSPNRLADETRRYLRQSRLRSEPTSMALVRMGKDLQLADAEPLAAAIASAEAKGVALSEALSAQAKAIRERRRLELIAAAERSQTRMALPIGLLILPAFLSVVLYPSVMQLLQITAR
ncbi:MAG: type II secretion system F family protein [Actinomycetota bacterium]